MPAQPASLGAPKTKTGPPKSRETALFLSSPGPGPVQSLLVGLSPDQLVAPPCTDMDRLYLRVSRCVWWWEDCPLPLDSVWGTLRPVLGMYLAKAEVRVARRTSTESTAFMVFGVGWDRRRTDENGRHSREHCYHGYQQSPSTNQQKLEEGDRCV